MKKKSWQWASNSDSRQRKMYYRTFFRIIFISPAMFSKIFFVVGCYYNEECGVVNGEWEIENLKSKMISVEFLSLIMPNFREFLWKTRNEIPRYLVLNLRWNRLQMICNEWQKSQLMLSVWSYNGKLWPQPWKCCSTPQVEGSIFKTSVTVFHKTDWPAG